MLWTAGQKRIARENRERLAERFVTARDAALDVLVSTGQASPQGTWRPPFYIRPTTTVPDRSPDVRDATLTQLGFLYPGIVRRNDS